MKAWLARRARALKATIAALIIVAASLVSVAVTAGPAMATGSFATSAIADNAETHAVGSSGGQCKAFVNGVVSAVAGISPSGYQTGFANAGAVEITDPADAVRGDIIQITPAGSETYDANGNSTGVESLYDYNNPAERLHTTIIRGPRNSDGTFNVIDSNWSTSNTQLVSEHSFNPYTWAAGSIIKIWRFGTPTSSGASSRIIVLDSSGVLSVKEGALNASWVPVDSGVVDYRASSNRIAALDSSGTLWVKDGPINAVWQQVATGVSPGDFAVTDNMVAVLWGTDLYTKVGSLGTPWGLTLNPVQSFQVSSGGHIAADMTNGTLEVQWGAVGTGWVAVTSGMTEYQITDDMVAATFGTDLYVKYGSVGAVWSLVMNPVNGFQVSSGDHIAADMNGSLNVEWGSIGSGWTSVASGYSSYAITDTRVGILQSGTLSIKDGSVGATWTQVATSITSFTLT